MTTLTTKYPETPAEVSAMWAFSKVRLDSFVRRRDIPLSEKKAIIEYFNDMYEFWGMILAGAVEEQVRRAKE